jgi:DNA replication protein DnaC
MENEEQPKSAADIASRFGEAVRMYSQAKKQQSEATDPLERQFDGQQYMQQIPKRIQKHITPKHPKVDEILKLIRDEQPIIILSGQNRMGKSTLAASVAIATGKPFVWHNAFDLLETIKASWQGKAPWKRPKHPLMVIDELEKVVKGEWAELVIDQTICNRYDNCQSTIVVTNLTADQIKANASNRFIHRVREQQTFFRIKEPWWK